MTTNFVAEMEHVWTSQFDATAFTTVCRKETTNLAVLVSIF